MDVNKFLGQYKDDVSKARATLTEICDLLMYLDAQEHDVLYARYIEFLTFDEISKRMELSISRVYTLHANGLKSLERKEDEE